jgi:hypothetical protein
MKRLMPLLLVLLVSGCGRYLYGYDFENAFLVSCEQKGGMGYCACALDWIERTTQPQEFITEVTTYQQTGTFTGSIEFVKTVCSLVGPILY